ncbi:hypothetical protein G6F35_014614 [Rhizopus arrhizus]|nr:hypothetical protein G6F35_014614 [Rhizopus arrhizus]
MGRTAAIGRTRPVPHGGHRQRGDRGRCRGLAAGGRCGVVLRPGPAAAVPAAAVVDAAAHGTQRGGRHAGPRVRPAVAAGCLSERTVRCDRRCRAVPEPAQRAGRAPGSAVAAGLDGGAERVRRRAGADGWCQPPLRRPDGQERPRVRDRCAGPASGV